MLQNELDESKELKFHPLRGHFFGKYFAISSSLFFVLTSEFNSVCNTNLSAGFCMRISCLKIMHVIQFFDEMRCSYSYGEIQP